MAAASVPASLPPTAGLPPRLTSLDAYRGFVMLAMASHGLGLPAIAKQYPDSRLWQAIGWQFEHVPWVGCSFWDLIQPSFMFMVGVSLAYSYAARAAKGESRLAMLGHAAWRALLLILLGVFLRSNTTSQTNYTFVDVTTQIGLGYLPLFLLWNRRPAVQWGAVAAVLIGDWLLFALYPPPPVSDWAALAGSRDWEPFTGLAAHWNKNNNVAHAFDVWFLNLFPRDKPFVLNSGGYQTLNFIPSLATMILGLLAGEWLRGPAGGRRKSWTLLAAGLAGLAAGYALHAAGLCPLVKRIWTPSWALYSAGWAAILLAAFYGAIELAGWRAWSFPLVVVGMNSVAMYAMSYLIDPWIARTLQTHLGPRVFQLWGLADAAFEPLLRSVVVLACLWLICFWMYRRRIFLRI